MAKSRMHSLEYSTQFKKDFKKITKLPIPDIVEVGRIISKLQRVFHTGADPMERLRLRPSFEGAVKSGAHYVLVDDVTSMGGTLAELANYLLDRKSTRLNSSHVRISY